MRVRLLVIPLGPILPTLDLTHDDFHQDRPLDRLRREVVTARRQALVSVRRHGVSREGDDRQIVARPPQGSRSVVAVEREEAAVGVDAVRHASQEGVG